MADTPAPFLLTPRLVAEKALPLLIEGKLSGQVHPGAGRGCYYRHPTDGAPCVIGSALPDAVARAGDLTQSGNIKSVAILGLVEATGPDLSTLSRWQRLHDNNDFDELRTALEAELAKSA